LRRCKKRWIFCNSNPDIEMFELFILDNNGVPRGKLLHRDELLAVYESGRPLPSTILGLSINGDDVENSGLVWEVGDIDCRAYPISGSLQRMPWRLIPMAAVQVSMHPEQGMPATVADPRHLLAKVIDGLKADGYYPVMAAELEFYLLDQKRDSNGRPQPARDADGQRPRATQVYGLRELEQIEPFLADLYSACNCKAFRRARRFPNTHRGKWKSPSNTAADALQAMDEAVRYKRLVKGVAHKHGMAPVSWPSRLTTWPAPACTCTSAWPTRTATTCLPVKRPTARRCSPGGGRHAQHLARFTADVLPQCQLLSTFPEQQLCAAGCHLGRGQSHGEPAGAGRPGFFAAYRAPHLRRRCQPVPGGSGHSGRDSSRHSRAARSGRAGPRQRLRPGQAELLPTDWLTTLRALEGSDWAKEAFGAEFLKVYLAVKNAEYRQFMGEVGEQDWRWYLQHA
jgi:glutamine synthetase